MRDLIKGITIWLGIPVIFWSMVIYGCASIGKFSPQKAEKATNAVTTPQRLLHSWDGFITICWL